MNDLNSSDNFAPILESLFFNSRLPRMLFHSGNLVALNEAAEKRLITKKGSTLDFEQLGQICSIEGSSLRDVIDQPQEWAGRYPLLTVDTDRSSYPLEVDAQQDWVLLTLHSGELRPVSGKAISHFFDSLVELPGWIQCISDLNRLAEKDPKQRVTLMSLSIDDFDSFSNAYGYANSDRLSRYMADKIEYELSDCQGALYSLSGSAFLYRFAESKSDSECGSISDRLVEAFQDPIVWPELTHRVALTMGFATDTCDDPQNLLQAAQIALADAAQTPDDCYQIFTESMRDAQKETLNVRQQLKAALDESQFELYYQPQKHLRSGQILGVEALIRWRHPTRGLLTPIHFIEVAEATDLIIPITYWVLDEACRQAAEWLSQGLNPMVVSVNIPAKFISEEDAEKAVSDALKKYGLDPHCLGIELTESALFEVTEQLKSILEHWASIGITISIDDFGTGYSNLAYLARMKIHKLKIDQQFVQQFPLPRENRAIIGAIILLSRTLGLETIAEGVERESMMQALSAMGCGEVQGYALSVPIPAADFVQWYENFHQWPN